VPVTQKDNFGPRNSRKEPGFLPESFDEFVSTLGVARAAEWVDRLDLLLASAFVDDNRDPVALGKAAHAMVSQAGTLGFVELARRSSRLEQAIAAGRPYPGELEAVRQEAHRVAAVLSRLGTDLSEKVRSSQK